MRYIIIFLSGALQMLCWFTVLDTVFVNSLPHPFWSAIESFFVHNSFTDIAWFAHQLPVIVVLVLTAYIVHVSFYLYRRIMFKAGLN